MGKHLYKDRAVINNNCYRLIAFETAFENKEQRFMHSCLTFQCETKRIIQSKLRAGLQCLVLLVSLAICKLEETTFFFYFHVQSKFQVEI